MIEAGISAPNTEFGVKEAPFSRSLVRRVPQIPQTQPTATSNLELGQLVPPSVQEGIPFVDNEILRMTNIVGEEVVIPIGAIRMQVAVHSQWREQNPLVLASIKKRIARRREEAQFQEIKDPFFDRQTRQLALYTLTPSQYTALYLTPFQLKRDDAAKVMGIDPQTHKHHVSDALRKIEVPRDTSAWLIALKAGFIDQSLLPSYPDYRNIYLLTEREQEILEMRLARPDLTTKQLAYELFITEQTVKNHNTNTFRTLRAGSSIDSAMLYYIGWMDWKKKLQQGKVPLNEIEQKVLSRLEEGQPRKGILQELGIDEQAFMLCEKVLNDRFGEEYVTSLRRPQQISLAPSGGEVELQLTDREMELLGCLGRGMSNKEIAVELVLAESTVKNLLVPLIRKIGKQNRNDAGVLANEQGFGTKSMTIDMDSLYALPKAVREILDAHLELDNLCTVKKIAEATGKAVSTVKNMRTRLYALTGVSTPQQLHLIARAVNALPAAHIVLTQDTASRQQGLSFDELPQLVAAD